MESKEIDREFVTSKPLSNSGASKLLRGIIAKFLERNPNVRSNIRRTLLRIPKVPILPGVIGDIEKSVLKSVFPQLSLFNSKEDLMFFLKRLKSMNLGSSVVVSGLFSEVNECLKKMGICPHSVEYSLGIFGNKKLLPKEELLQITTMCGHHMISPKLVEKLCGDVARSRITYEEAAQVMAKQCVCGAFNVNRAVRLMKDFAAVS